MTKPYTKTAFGFVIRSARQSLGMTQWDVAKRLGITRGAIAQWEHGISEPLRGRLIQLRDILGLTSDQILS